MTHTPAGPWEEYDANPLIAREWASHEKVSHVSASYAVGLEEDEKLLL